MATVHAVRGNIPGPPPVTEYVVSLTPAEAKALIYVLGDAPADLRLRVTGQRLNPETADTQGGVYDLLDALRAEVV